MQNFNNNATDVIGSSGTIIVTLSGNLITKQPAVPNIFRPAHVLKTQTMPVRIYFCVNLFDSRDRTWQQPMRINVVVQGDRGTLGLSEDASD